MGTKIKFIFAGMAVIAVFSVLSWVDYFNKGLASGFSFKNIANKFSFESETDADKDGLSNIDESYWNTDFQNPDTDGDGFKDGEEIASGHDPRKPGPDDSLSDINLTEKLAELTASGLYEGSLKPDNENYYQSLTDMTEYLDDNSRISLNTNIAPEILKTIDGSRENQDKYLGLAYGSIKTFLVSYGEEMNNLNKNLDLIGAYGFGNKDVKEYFSKQENIFKDIFNKASDVPVPKNWTTEHLQLLGEIKMAAESNRAVVLGSSDPVKAAMALNELFSILDRIPDWTKKYIDKNRSEDINNLLIESLSK